MRSLRWYLSHRYLGILLSRLYLNRYVFAALMLARNSALVLSSPDTRSGFKLKKYILFVRSVIKSGSDTLSAAGLDFGNGTFSGALESSKS